MKTMKVSEGARVMMLVAGSLLVVPTVVGGEVTQRLRNAMVALQGEGERTPDVVVVQQRHERVRQDAMWTLENQAKYPKEYCQAQLDELAKYAKQLDVLAHKCAVAKVRTERLLADDKGILNQLGRFLDEAKRLYRKADAESAWPAKLRGVRFSKKSMQTKILEAAQKIETLKARLEQRERLSLKIASRQERIAQEQQNVVRIRELVRRTLTDLELSAVVEADQGIADAVRAIGDSLQALNFGGEENLSVEELIRVETDDSRQAAFDAIMAQ